MINSYERVNVDLMVKNTKDEQIVLYRVPAIKTTTGKILFDPNEVVKAQNNGIASDLEIKPREIPLFLLFYAPAGQFQRGYLYNKYKLNKMLFYQWKELERKGLGHSFDTYNFVADKKGPVPVELKDDLIELKEKGLIELSGGKDEHKMLQAKLTDKGETVAEKLWSQIPKPYKETSFDVKTQLFPLDPRTIMEKVHKEYPEYRFSEIDEE